MAAAIFVYSLEVALSFILWQSGGFAPVGVGRTLLALVFMAHCLSTFFVCLLWLLECYFGTVVEETWVLLESSMLLKHEHCLLYCP